MSRARLRPRPARRSPSRAGQVSRGRRASPRAGTRGHTGEQGRRPEDAGLRPSEAAEQQDPTARSADAQRSAATPSRSRRRVSARARSGGHDRSTFRHDSWVGRSHRNVCTDGGKRARTETLLIDTDTASDDAVALSSRSAVPTSTCAAITVVAGNVPVEQGVQNALYTARSRARRFRLHRRAGPRRGAAHGTGGPRRRRDGDIGLPLHGREPATATPPRSSWTRSARARRGDARHARATHERRRAFEAAPDVARSCARSS